MVCRFCGGQCVRNGRQSNGKQRFQCKCCHKKQQEEYSYQAYAPQVNQYIISHLKEGVGIRSLARLLQISTTTLLKRILNISHGITTPHITANSVYEVDKIRTFVFRKSDLIWIAYALDRNDKSVAAFSVGPRTNKTLNRVLDKLRNAQRIYTDRLKNYRYLIVKSVYRTSLYGTNHIEWNNLTLRTHLKRLTRRTICFSRKVSMLYAVLKIYFWG